MLRSLRLPLLCLAVFVAATPSQSAQDAPRLRTEPPRPPGARPAVPSTPVPPPETLLAPPAEAREAPGGVRYVFVERGDGDRPIGGNDRIWMHYTAWRPDGSVLETTEGRAKGRRIDVRSLMHGLVGVVVGARVGDRMHVWLPAETTAMPDREPLDEPLMFDLEIEHARFAPSRPEPFEKPRRAKRHGVRTSDSGLAWLVLERPEHGEPPREGDMIVADFAVWAADGTLLDSSEVDGEPAVFELATTIPVFAEAFSTMVPGERRILWAPAELARQHQTPGVGEHGDLVIEVAMRYALPRPDTPADVAMAPPGAERTPLGVPYRVLKEGTGDRRPIEGDRVDVVYAGWTRDGEMFDASYRHGKPGSFVLGPRMPLGWNDALYQMVVGEKRRIWIPEELAYAGAPDRPEGMLVFDVELVGIGDDAGAGDAEPATR